MSSSKNPPSPSKNPPSPNKNARSPTKPPTISIRTSSKRALEQVESELLNARKKLDQKKQCLKPSKSFDSDYWSGASEYAVMGRSVSQLELQKAAIIYVQIGQGLQNEFEQSDKARALEEQAKTWVVKEKIFSKRSGDLKMTSKEPSLRRSFMQLVTSSPFGLDIKHAFSGKRDSSMQSNFRGNIMKYQSLQHHDTLNYHDFYWNVASWD